VAPELLDDGDLAPESCPLGGLGGLAMIYLLAFLTGIFAGLRTMAAPAAVSWAARFGVLNLHGTRLGFLGAPFTPWLLTALAIFELIGDQLPTTPSRKVPAQFAARMFSGGLCGAAIGVGHGMWFGGLVAGVVGAIVGTLGGYEGRKRLAQAFHKDKPAALIEDASTIVGLLIVMLLVASFA
jgi:uncharacterized membrane protein